MPRGGGGSRGLAEGGGIPRVLSSKGRDNYPVNTQLGWTGTAATVSHSGGPGSWLISTRFEWSESSHDTHHNSNSRAMSEGL